MIIETERLIIRPPRKGDAIPINNAIQRSLTELTRWMPWAADPSLKTSEEFIEKGIEQWDRSKQQDFPMIIELKANNQIISASGFNENSQPDVPMFEIGYWVDSQHSGKGYVTEAVKAMTKYAFNNLKAVRVQICAQAENSKSIAVAKRCGYIQEAILKNYRLDCLNNKPCDEVILACFSTKQITS